MLSLRLGLATVVVALAAHARASFVMTPGSFSSPQIATSFLNSGPGLGPIVYGSGDRQIAVTGTPLRPNQNSNNFYTTDNAFSIAANGAFTMTFTFTGIASEDIYAFGLHVQKFNGSPSTTYTLKVFDDAGTTELGSQTIISTVNQSTFFMGLGGVDSIGKATLEGTADLNGRVDALFDGVFVQNTAAVPEAGAWALVGATMLGVAGVCCWRQRSKSLYSVLGADSLICRLQARLSSLI